MTIDLSKVDHQRIFDLTDTDVCEREIKGATSRNWARSAQEVVIDCSAGGGSNPYVSPRAVVGFVEHERLNPVLERLLQIGNQSKRRVEDGRIRFEPFTNWHAELLKKIQEGAFGEKQEGEDLPLQLLALFHTSCSQACPTASRSLSVPPFATRVNAAGDIPQPSGQASSSLPEGLSPQTPFPDSPQTPGAKNRTSKSLEFRAKAATEKETERDKRFMTPPRAPRASASLCRMSSSTVVFTIGPKPKTFHVNRQCTYVKNLNNVDGRSYDEAIKVQLAPCKHCAPNLAQQAFNERAAG